jgi:hypothetical protein
MITLAPDDNISSQMITFSSQMITFSSQMITFSSR